jgi:GMP synthase (glutamine-hydrolysing)
MDSRTYAIRHVAFEDLGLWQSQLSGANRSVRYFQAGIDDLTPCIHDDPELLVVLGGPLGVYEADQYPFIATELEALRRRLERNLPVLGLCLGAQMIAAAAGARVYPSGIKEIGWAPIALTPAGNASCLKHLQSSDYTVLHWHGDTFDLPDGATLLASTSQVKHQAFALGKALALQFHVEADPQKIESWLIGHTCELGHAGVKPADLRRASQQLPSALRTNSELALSSWLKEVGLL